MSFLRKKSGFSLVELMIVVGIIGILAVLAVPKFQTFRFKAMRAEAYGTLKHLETLWESCIVTGACDQASFNMQYIMGSTFTSPTSCYAPDPTINPIGYVPINCLTLRYTPQVIGQTWLVSSTANFCKINGADSIVFNHNCKDSCFITDAVKYGCVAAAPADMNCLINNINRHCP